MKILAYWDVMQCRLASSSVILKDGSAFTFTDKPDDPLKGPKVHLWRCHIPEDLNIQQYHCENTKSHNLDTNYKAYTSLINKSHPHLIPSHTFIFMDIWKQAVLWAQVLNHQPLSKKTNEFQLLCKTPSNVTYCKDQKTC
jgi:hypothetical protein